MIYRREHKKHRVIIHSLHLELEITKGLTPAHQYKAFFNLIYLYAKKRILQ